MNKDEMNKLISNLFAKADIPESPPEHTDPYTPDPMAIFFVYSAHTIINQAIKLVEDHQENKTEIDQDRLFFLLTQAKNTLEISFRSLHKFLPEEMKNQNKNK